MTSNLFEDLNHQPARHTSFSFEDPFMFNESSCYKPSMEQMNDDSFFNQSTFQDTTMFQNPSMEQMNDTSFVNPNIFQDPFMEQMNDNSFFNQQPTMQRLHINDDLPMQDVKFSHPLMSELPDEFHPYVTHIDDVNGDGNCGFRSIAVSLGYHENEWRKIRRDLSEELLSHQGEYGDFFGADINHLTESLDYFKSPAPQRYWMIMPDTGLLAANKYGVIVHYLSKKGSMTIFPNRYAPSDLPQHTHVAIGHVNGCHYVKIDLEGEYPMATSLRNTRRRDRNAIGWLTVYSDRLSAYNEPNAPRGDRPYQIVDL